MSKPDSAFENETKVETENLEQVTHLLIGRTITAFVREPYSGEDWGHGENSVTITLDDGAELSFTGWGYDASGLNTYYKAAARAEEVRTTNGKD